MKNKNININNYDFSISETELLFHIEKFLRRITNVMPKEYLDQLRNNLENLKIKNSLVYYFLHNVSDNKKYEMNYNALNNKIKYNNDYIYMIYQTLFHVATTYVDNKTIYQGLSFGKRHDKKRNGRGFDNGYTLLLTERYFCDENKGEYSGRYEKSIKIMQKLENIIGEEEMLNCYMNANVLKFRKELLKYANEAEVNTLFYLVDSLKDFEDKKDFIKIGSLYNETLRVLEKIEERKKSENLLQLKK